MWKQVLTALVLIIPYGVADEDLACRYLHINNSWVLATDNELQQLILTTDKVQEVVLYHAGHKCLTRIAVPGLHSLTRILLLHDDSLLIAGDTDNGGKELYLRTAQGEMKKIQAAQLPHWYVPIREIEREGKYYILLQGAAEPQSDAGLYLLDYQAKDPVCRLYHAAQKGVTAYAFHADGRVVAHLRWLEDGSKCIETLNRELYRVSSEDRLQLIGLKNADCVYVIHDNNLESAVLSEINLQTGVITKLADGGRADVSEFLMTADGELAGYCTLWDTQRYTALLPCGDVSELRPLLPPDTQIIPIQLSSDAKRMLVRLTPPGEPSYTALWERGRQLTPLGKTEDLPPVYPTQFAQYPAADGTMIPLYYTLPRGKGPFPTIIFVHGGPRMRTDASFDWRVQYLVSQGFAVVQPQFRGSRGWGKSFMHAGNRQWGKGVMQTDVNDAIPWLVQQGIAEPGRIGILGGSYGGYAVTAGLCFYPGMYACGVSLFGPQDLLLLLSKPNGMEIPFASEDKLTTGDANDAADVERMRDISPALHAENFQDPLLIYYGELDTLIPPEHSRMLIRAMRAAGKAVTVLSLPDEAHGFAIPEREAALYARHIVPFFQKHLNKHER